MANQNCKQDDNQWPAMIAHSGTAGTAETVRVVADSAGNLGVNIVSGEIIASLGTVDVLKAGSVVVTAGTIAALTNGSSYFKLSDENGTAYGVRHVDNKPIVSSMPYTYDIAEGNVTGHTNWSKMGFNPDIGTANETLWSAGALYTFPASAMQMEVASSNNIDDIGHVLFSGTSSGGDGTTLINGTADFTAGTAVAIGDCVVLDASGGTPEWGYVTAVGTTTLTFSNGFSSGGVGSARAYSVIDKSAYNGGQAVKIEYLDSTYASKSEIVLLNGTAPVDTVGTGIFRINSFRLISTGSNNVPTGNITVKDTGAATTYSYITAGFTRARNIVYTVPLGKTLYIHTWSVSWGFQSATSKNEYCRFYTRANVEPSTMFNTGSMFYPYTEVNLSGGVNTIEFLNPTKLPAKTDLKVDARASAAGGAGVTVLRGWLE
jgi:hypothetical protein